MVVVGGILKLKNNVFIKLHKTLLMGRNDYKSRYVAKDVKKGHFVVIAKDEDEDEAKRFIVPLSCLANPIFVSLLEQAAEKFGFNGDGALTIPCRPNELKMLLVQQLQDEGSYCSDHVMFICYQRRPSGYFKLKQIV
ncbi:putative small auxin-up RNA [Medicago truncatula]|uniref:Putative small auxin-up RNA n=1 Tax=Medicago truncatula TaxID=3880 RepID=A0A072ULQ3_MEDTR|nr:auxin-responsive protein SAUR21 [Medicago truncatula]KEH29998.1 SAUR-like auxin-responsive family protein [Medicago truncatula]RHN60683.1 putative small auxin-up RNA [Medicago truncatula]